MKKFILYFLSGIGVLSLLLGVILLWAVTSFISSLSSPHEKEPLSSQSILTLTLGAQPMMECNFHGSLMSVLKTQHAQSLLETLDAIREAKQDPNIKGILLNIEGGHLSLSHAHEIRQELIRFQEGEKGEGRQPEKKPVYAFSYGFSESSNGTVPYYLASVADEIYMQKASLFSVNGFILESFFLKNLLDDLKLSIQSDRREKYKGVIEPFTQAAFSTPVRENLQSVLDDLFIHVQEKIANSRHFTSSQAEEMVNQSPHLDYQAVQKKYITNLAYKDEVREKIEKKVLGEDPKGTGDKVKFISAKSYLEQVKGKETSEKIGIIVLDGEIISPGDDPTGVSPFSPEGIDKAFKSIKKNKSIKAIVLRINSPGGSVSGAEAIWYAVKRTIDSKMPVVVSMGGMAASAGYYIAAPATKIYALPTTLTGSIGVAFGKPNIRQTTEKYGVTWDTIEAGANGTMWSMTHDFSPAIWERLQASVSHTYHQFKEKVIQGRNMSPEKVQSIAQGRVWTGLQAKEHKLVDEIGGFFDAVEAARLLGGIKNHDPDLVVLNQHVPAFSLLFDLLGTEAMEKIRLEVIKALPQARLESKLQIGHMG